MIKINLIDKHELTCGKCVNFEYCGNLVAKENTEKVIYNNIY